MKTPHEREGVVRFTAEHQSGPPPEHPALSDLGTARDELFRRGLIGVTPEGIGYGNVSLRDDSALLISGTGTGGLPHLAPEHWCRVVSCDPAGNRLVSCGPIAASSESLTHAAAYAADPYIHCVVHVHSAALCATLLRDKTPATPHHVTYGTPAMADAVMDCVRRQSATGVHQGIVVMAGHPGGILAWGPDVATACSFFLDG